MLSHVGASTDSLSVPEEANQVSELRFAQCSTLGDAFYSIGEGNRVSAIFPAPLPCARTSEVLIPSDMVSPNVSPAPAKPQVSRVFFRNFKTVDVFESSGNTARGHRPQTQLANPGC